MVKDCIAIIPARGGSKRIPGKNIIGFNGVPMIARTINSASQSGIFSRIIVSTDDEKIADISRKFGAEVPFLRTECCDDFSTVSQATIFAIKQAEAYYGESYKNVIQLMANCPLRNAQDIVAAYDHFCTSGSNFQISCFKFGWMNPWWAMKLDKAYVPTKLFPETGEKRSQDLPELYCPTGAIWIADVDALKQCGTFYGDGYKAFPLDWKSAVDIDNYDDLELALTLDGMCSNLK